MIREPLVQFLVYNLFAKRIMGIDVPRISVTESMSSVSDLHIKNNNYTVSKCPTIGPSVSLEGSHFKPKSVPTSESKK